MSSKNIILNSLKESFLMIWRNKSLFFLLFVLQIIFSGAFGFINLTYQTRILENANAMSDYLANQDLDELSVTQNLLAQKDILGDDPGAIDRHFSEIVKNFKIYLAYTFLLLVVFLSIVWSLTNKFLRKINFNKLKTIFLKNLLVSAVFLFFIFSFFYSILNISFTEAATQGLDLFKKYIPVLIFAIVLVYFMFISLSLTYKTGLKDIIPRTIKIGLKKAHYIIAVYVINTIMIYISMFLMHYFIEINILIQLVAVLLFILTFIFARIFMMNVVDKLEI